LEYYRGIIVLTTNRIKAFDEAFLSRIHVALHFEDLSQESKERLWAAFLCKVAAEDITQKQIEELARRDVNGRQIKNAVRTAQSLAVARREKIAFEHFAETLDAMNQFTTQFEAVKLRSAESA
jgi:SpoVK/Ycf46/Vps4 family AAA+-type ATPase